MDGGAAVGAGCDTSAPGGAVSGQAEEVPWAIYSDLTLRNSNTCERLASLLRA